MASKIIVVSKNLMTGGIENSFINFTTNVKDIVDVDVFLCNNNGALKDKMPKDVKIFEGNKIIKSLNGADFATTTNTPQKSFKLKRFFRNCAKFIVNKLHIKGLLKWFGIAITKKIKQEYDCALCFYGQSDICNKITIKKIKAKQKWAFIHCDVSKFDVGKVIEKQLVDFDKILCVSKSCAEIFRQKYTKLANKVDYLHNFQNNERIKTLSTEFSIEYPKTFNIVTVARLSELEKGIIRSLDIFKKLHNEGYDFHWHIVGDGGDRKLIENHMKSNNMESYVTFYGNKPNPYPYIKSADMLFLGSYHESWGIVLVEALTLGVPVLTTRTSSAEEILGNKCFICENNPTGIYENLKFIFDNPDILKIKKDEIGNYEFDNDAIKNRLISLIGGLK